MKTLIDIQMNWTHTSYMIRYPDDGDADLPFTYPYLPFIVQKIGNFSSVQYTLWSFGINPKDFRFQITQQANSSKTGLVDRTYGIAYDAIPRHPNIILDIDMPVLPRVGEIRITRLTGSSMTSWIILGYSDSYDRGTSILTFASTLLECHSWLGHHGRMGPDIGIWFDGVLSQSLSTDGDWALAILKW